LILTTVIVFPARYSVQTPSSGWGSSSSRACASRSSPRRSTWPLTTSGTRSGTACRTWWCTPPSSTSPSPASSSASDSTSCSSTAPWPACPAPPSGPTSGTGTAASGRSSPACSAASATASSSWAARPQGTPPLTLSRPCRSSAPSGAYCSSGSTASRRGRPTSCSASCSSCSSPLSPCSWLRQVTGAQSELQVVFVLCLQALPLAIDPRKDPSSS
jgi:hypothetical protein